MSGDDQAGDGGDKPPGRGAFTVRVTLRAVGPGPPAIIRLRRWLKTALRSWGLRAVALEEVVPDAERANNEHLTRRKPR